MEFKIVIKGYPEEAKELVNILNNHIEHSIGGLKNITFVNKRPQNPKNHNRRISGLKAESIACIGEDKELIKMSAENFIYLMAKSGVIIEAEEVSGKCDHRQETEEGSYE